MQFRNVICFSPGTLWILIFPYSKTIEKFALKKNKKKTKNNNNSNATGGPNKLKLAESQPPSPSGMVKNFKTNITQNKTEAEV